MQWIAEGAILDPTDLGVHQPPRPREAIKMLNRTTENNHKIILLLILEKTTRLSVASIKGSWRSVASGVRAWAASMDRMHPEHFPAQERHIWEFTAIFKHGGTLNNYLGYIKASHDIMRIEFNWSTQILSRISRGSNKITIRKEKPRIRKAHHLQLAAIARQEGDMRAVAIMAIARTWLTRVQSELIPLERDGIADAQDTSWHSTIQFSDDGSKATITWRRRKNTDRITSITRSCCCKEHPDLCGVCHLRTFHDQCERGRGVKICKNIKIAAITADLRRRATRAGNPMAHIMGWHAFRRGKASDMLIEGSPISTILQAGGWKSSSVLNYLVLVEVQQRIASIATVDGSDSEEQ